MNSGGWFALEELEPGTWLVGEPGHVNCFLVAGRERAALIDTGLGIADIGLATGKLTDRPVVVVNTHSHSDHRGGNWRFAEVAAHPLAAKTLTQPVDREYLKSYLKVARAQLAAYQRARESDDRFFHLFTAATRPRPVPEGADDWTVPGGPEPTPLADGERIDLGGRELTVLHTPGHSPDSLCLLDERARPAVRRRHTHHRRLLGAHARHRDRGLRGDAAQAGPRARGRSDRDLPGPHSPLPRQAGLPASGGRRLRGDRGRFQHRQARHRPAATPGVTA